jgi:hypothetical protein
MASPKRGARSPQNQRKGRQIELGSCPIRDLDLAKVKIETSDPAQICIDAKLMHAIVHKKKANTENSTV